MARLVINPTSASRREIALERAGLSIGRDPANDLVLPDAMVSRRHALIEFHANQYFLRDCNSSNGSLVNGERITECRLKDGDLLAIGAMRILFREEAQEIGSESSAAATADSRRVCPNCRTAAHSGDHYCHQCGAQIVTEPIAKMLCPLCSSIVMLPARYCHACGSELQRENEKLDTTRPRPVLDSTPSKPQPSVSEKSPKPAEDAAALPSAPPPSCPPRLRSPSEARAAQASPDSVPQIIRPRLPAVPAASAGTSRSSQPAGAWRRLAAAVVDAALVSLGMLLLLSPAIYYWWPREISEVSYPPILLSAILVLVSVLLGCLYYVYFWGIQGATPGKQVFGLMIQSRNGVVPIGVGRATLRLFGYGVSSASLGIGFLLIVFTGHGLHDHIAGTRVVRQDAP